VIVPSVPQTVAGVAEHYDELDVAYRRVWGDHVHHGYWRTGRESAAEAVEALVRLVEARLDLEPGPGLTLVVGRNGSGKSSFAEALELLLTGENSRWQGKTKVWREAWRNLHAPGDARIVARFQVDGRPGVQSLRRRWQADDALEAARTEPHLGTTGAEDELAAWQQAVRRYRPFLSYSQLEDLLESPADLYAALNAVLGIEDVDAAREVLRQARLDGERAAKAVRTERLALLPELAAADDPRAAACHAALAQAPE
jgi:energy-coupling factor transporter ATP-binding protein EcfA2